MKKLLNLFIISASLFCSSAFTIESGDYVCYTYSEKHNAKWCGVVLQDYGKAVKVEVTEVTCDRFLCTQLDAETCSGHKDLPIGSSGQTITVKKYCIE